MGQGLTGEPGRQNTQGRGYLHADMSWFMDICLSTVPLPVTKIIKISIILPLKGE